MIKKLFRFLVNLINGKKDEVKTSFIMRFPRRDKATLSFQKVREHEMSIWAINKRKEINELVFNPNPSNITHIVIHHSLSEDTMTRNWGAIDKYHKGKGWDSIGYHMGSEKVGHDYNIMIGRPLNKRGAHALDGGFNNFSIGICVVGNWDNEPPPTKQWRLTLMLVSKLLVYYENKGIHIPVDNVLGHREAQEIAGVPEVLRKSCPGTLFSMHKFRKELKPYESI